MCLMLFTGYITLIYIYIYIYICNFVYEGTSLLVFSGYRDLSSKNRNLVHCNLKQTMVGISWISAYNWRLSMELIARM